MKKTYYKFLRENGEAIYGMGKWFLPKNGRPGKWMPKIENIKLCERGYHVCERKDLLYWLEKDCWIVEVRGEEITGSDKSVFSEARLIKKTRLDECSLRLFAADCAEKSLKYVKDDSKKKILKRTIQIARAYAFELVSEEIRMNAFDSVRALAICEAVIAASNATAPRAPNFAPASVNAFEKTKDWQTKRLEEYILGKVDLKKMKIESIEWVEKNIKEVLDEK